MPAVSPDRPHFHFITLFPETIDVWLRSSILGRARNRGLFDFSLYQLRDFSQDRYRSVDDSAYGGGGGMVLRLEPLVAAVEAIAARFPEGSRRVLYFSPAGERLVHRRIRAWAGEGIAHYILICGHYEGVDQRFLDHWVDAQVSLGDFVLTGGELPAVAFADALIRQLEGVLHHEHATDNESFALTDPLSGSPLLEHPHYTRPAEFRGHPVPPVLLEGNHEAIARWRLEQARERTRRERPDLCVTGDADRSPF
jgi:tRNA (guanine37-N1)-methyltransferase